MKRKICSGIVVGLLLLIFPVADAATTLYEYTFQSDVQGWSSAGTCSGGSCTLTSGWKDDGNPPGSVYFNQTATTTSNRNTESAWSSPDLAWSNGMPTSAKLNFSYRVLVGGQQSRTTISAYIIKTDNTAVLVYQGGAITSNTTWLSISAPVGIENFTTAGNYKIRLNGSLYTTNPGLATVRWDTVNLTLVWESPQPPQTYIPPQPSGLTPTQAPNNFWVNYTWTAGAGENITDSYNVSHNNDPWSNNTITFRNNTVGPHGWSNITVYAYNSSGTGQLSQTAATMDTQVNNNAPILDSIGDKEVTAGQLLTIMISATDADSDPLTNATNATKGSFTSPDTYTWTPGDSDAGTYVWEFNTSDNYGGVDNETITVTVNAANYIPPTPLIAEILTGNFWINYSWIAGLGSLTDSYNVSVNDSWINGTTQTFNLSNVGAHGWSNITLYAFNNSGTGSLSSEPLVRNIQVPDNLPVQSLADTWSIKAGNMLTIPVSATDADSDILTFDTNATGGSLNRSTGVYKWMPASPENGTYVWEFNSSDGYGGNATNTTTITVTDVLPGEIYINGTVTDRDTGDGIEGVTVSNGTISTTTDPSGFYSLSVTAGTHALTASLEPVYYTNDSVSASVETGVVVRHIELLIKPTGTITGTVTNG